MFVACCFLFLLFLEIAADREDPLKPVHVHLSLITFKTYAVTWNTFANPPSLPSVEWTHQNGRTRFSTGKTTMFENLNVTRYTHRALIRNIKPGIRYRYCVKTGNLKSREFSFVGIAKRKGGYRYAIFGDFGLKNAHKENGTVGDNFMQMIEPIASSLPYMTTPGNHEIEYNFTHYANRFTMPLDTANQCFDHGFAHFVMFSTEVYFAHTRMSPEFMIRQYKWLVEDLRKANENRKNVPWIVTFGHRPMYCSSEVAAYGVNDCHLVDSVIRKGIIGVKSLGLEDLFYKNGVDLEIWGHVHAYSRSWPVYDYKIYNGSKSPYVDPRAPIITGSAGCNELVENFTDPKNFDAYLSSHYGIGVMKIANKTHLHWQQFAAVKNLVDDDIWIVKNKHGPYN